MQKAVFPTYKDNWTRTPNVFFDEILTNPKITLNQVRLVAYLIRNTLGYNKDAKWAGITRSDLIDYAGIVNSRIKETLVGAEKNGWILIHEVEGKTKKKERYIFLCDERNQMIVRGLKQSFFKVGDLEYLNLAGIDALLEQHGLSNEENTHSSPVSGENTHSSPVSGEDTTPETGEDTTPETGEDDSQPAQEPQGLAEPLNTSFKDNIKRQQQEHQKNVVVVQDEFEKAFEKKIAPKKAEELIELAIENEKTVLDAIQETMMYYKQSGEEKKNPFGAVKYSLTTGWDVEDATTQGNTSVGVNRPTKADIERQEAVEDKMRRIMLERKQQREGAHHGA